jgi:hypothetical protein
MEPGGSLPCSQEPSNCPYPDPDQSPSYFSKIYFNIILPPISSLPSGPFPTGLSTKILYALLPIHATFLAHLLLLDLIILIIFGEKYKL